MKVLYIVAIIIIALIILAIIAILIATGVVDSSINSLISTPLPIDQSGLILNGGIFRTVNTELICQFFGNCAGANPTSPYGRAVFPFLGDTNLRSFKNKTITEQEATFVGAHPMSLQDAVVVWGNIPSNIYWSLTGYLYDIPDDTPKGTNGRFQIWGSIADSISSARIQASSDERIAVIMTANPDLYALLASRIEDIWQETPHRIVPLFIPANMYDPSYRYDILSRAVLDNSSDPSPKWDVMWATDPTIPDNTTPGIPLIPRSNANSERDILSLNEWIALATSMVQQSGYNIVSRFVTNPYLATVIPGGEDSGYQCLQYSQDCLADNRDTIYAVAPGIQVTPDQSLVVVALDHVQTGKAQAYSNISFFDQTTQSSYRAEITGKVGENLASSPCQAIKIITDTPPASVFNNGVATIAVAERIYIDPASTVGPSYDSILPAVVFVVDS